MEGKNQPEDSGKSTNLKLAVAGIAAAVGVLGVGNYYAVKSAANEQGEKTRQEAKEALSGAKNDLAKDVMNLPPVKAKVEQATKAGSGAVLGISNNCKQLTESASSKVVVTLNEGNGDKTLSTTEGSKKCRVVKKGDFYSAEYTDGASTESVTTSADQMDLKSPSTNITVTLSNEGKNCDLNIEGFAFDTQIPEITKECRKTVDNAYKTAQFIEALAVAKAKPE